MVRPRCESCGERLYLYSGPFSNYNWGKTPSHCPRCGKQINGIKQEQLNTHDALIWSFRCVFFIIFVIVVLVIVL